MAGCRCWIAMFPSSSQFSMLGNLLLSICALVALSATLRSRHLLFCLAFLFALHFLQSVLLLTTCGVVWGLTSTRVNYRPGRRGELLAQYQHLSNTSRRLPIMDNPFDRQLEPSYFSSRPTRRGRRQQHSLASPGSEESTTSSRTVSPEPDAQFALSIGNTPATEHPPPSREPDGGAAAVANEEEDDHVAQGRFELPGLLGFSTFGYFLFSFSLPLCFLFLPAPLLSFCSSRVVTHIVLPITA